MSLHRRREYLEVQEWLADTLFLHSDSKVSTDSIISFAGRIHTKVAYTELCKNLYQFEVTAELIMQKDKEILTTFKSQNSAISHQRVNSTIEDRLGVSNFSGQRTLLLYTDILIQNKPIWKQSRFDQDERQKDFLVGPLMLAATEAGDAERLIATLEYIQDINFKDDLKETTLHKAASRGQKDMVRLLLRKGASIEATNKYKNTPLHCAAQNGHTNTVELLLEKGARIHAMGEYNKAVEQDIKQGRLWIEGSSEFTETPLHLAVRNGHMSTVELLLEKGASVQASAMHYNTPLHLAKSTRLVELLLENGAWIDAPGLLGNTALHFAACSGDTTMAELLLRKGASIEASNGADNTPLHLANLNRQSSMVELLLRKGASIESIGRRRSLFGQPSWQG